MRRGHFEAVAPVCPACRGERDVPAPLVVRAELEADQDEIREGLIECPACRREFPIIDGIPLLVPDVRSYVATQLDHLTVREDLSDSIEGLLGEGSGPGSAFDTARSQISSYAWDHYGEFDPALDRAVDPRPGSGTRAMEVGLALAAQAGCGWGPGPLLDVGCGPGRVSFRLAEMTGHLVLGVDLGFHLLRVAARVLRRGAVRYPLRRGGVRYERREFPVPTPGANRVDFWACDGANLPLASGSVGGAVALNLIDCVFSPLDLLRSFARVLAPGAPLILAAPYDWSPAATAIEGWIGGHSPRSLGGGSSETVLRALLTPGGHPASIPGLELVAERDDVPWSVRLHDRSRVAYRLHLVLAVRR